MPPPDEVLLGRRFIALVVLAAGVQLWLNHHLGLSSQTPWVALGLGTLSGALGLAARLLSDDEKKGLGQLLRNILRILLHGGLLTWLWGIALIAAMFVSSVMILPEAGAKGKAILRSADRGVIAARPLDTGVVRFVVLTSPFGRPYRLSVPGFLDDTVTVFPLVGLKVTPDRDLRRSPSVLFRLSKEGVVALKSGGTFTVKVNGKDVIPAQKGPEGAFLVGRAQQIPIGSAALWRLELEGAGANAPLTALMMLAWSRQKVVEPGEPLQPEAVLLAEVRTTTDTVVSRAQVTLGREALTDTALIDVTN